MTESAQVGFGPEETLSHSPVTAAAAAASDEEALARGVESLKLDGDGEDRDGNGEDRDGDGEDLMPKAEDRGRRTEGEGTEAMAVGVDPPHVSVEDDVSGWKEAEMSEVERAWRGEEEWREEKEVAVGVDPPHVSVEDDASGWKEAEMSEVERAWRGEEEWREETDVAKEEAGKEEDENDAQREKGEGKGGRFSYPQRPGEPDCAYYIKTGYCAFGANCKFNHPHRGKRIPTLKPSELETCQVKEKEKEERSSSMGQIQCKYYQTPGGCKYGSNCRYMHEGEGFEASPELNFLGLPMRLGEKECTFYMRTGSCKFGSNCRFHHPNPTGMGESGPVSGYHGNGSQQHVSGVSPPSTAWSMQNHSDQSASYIDTPPSCVPGMLLPHHLHQNSEWNGYQVPPNSLYPLEGNKKYSSAQTVYKPTNMNGHSGQFQVQTEEYPERPGQPECQFYMENGSCRYKSSCRYHHPKDRLARPPMCLLSPMGLPLRPDQPVCTYYSRYGICKFGPTCRFDHPMDRGSSKTHHPTTAVIP